MMLGKRKPPKINRTVVMKEEEAADNSSGMVSQDRRWSQEEAVLTNKVDSGQLNNLLGGCA